jgi:hypothetical protein
MRSVARVQPHGLNQVQLQSSFWVGYGLSFGSGPSLGIAYISDA